MGKQKAQQKFWKGLLVKVFSFIGAAAIIFGVITGGAEVKSIIWGPSKPQILDAQDCSIDIDSRGEETVWFELLVNNTDSKDCSITSIDLTWPDGFNAEIKVIEGSAVGIYTTKPLPRTIPAGLTERIIISGSGHKMLGESKLLQPIQNSAEATIAVKFNTGYIIKKKIIFTIKHS